MTSGVITPESRVRSSKGAWPGDGGVVGGVAARLGCSRGADGPSLLAFILVCRYDDPVPLYRRNEIFARMDAARHCPRTNVGQWLTPDTTMVYRCGGR